MELCFTSLKETEMSSTLFATITFTVLIVVVPQLVAAYFNAPNGAKPKRKKSARLSMPFFSIKRKETP